MKHNYSLRNTAKLTLTGLALVATTGCVTLGGENGVWTVATSPFRPNQWKKHPTRTTAVTSAYIAGIAYGLSGGSSGGDTYTEPEQEQEDKKDDKDKGSEKPKEEPKDEDDGGADDGGI